MKRRLYIIIVIAVLSLCADNVFAQTETTQKSDNDTTTVKKDILKEFEYISFEDAEIKIKDSSYLSQHLLGVKWSYNISNVYFSQDIDHKSVNSYKNIGLYYAYLHSLWKTMPYFGFQTGIEYNETGYILIRGEEPDITKTKEIYKNIQLPFLALFRMDFWKIRLMVEAGPFAGYKIGSNLAEGIPSTTEKINYGIIGGGGVAFVAHPFEFHITANYRYSLSGLYDPQIYSKEYWLYTHENQISFSFGIFYRFKNKYYKKRK